MTPLHTIDRHGSPADPAELCPTERVVRNDHEGGGRREIVPPVVISSSRRGSRRICVIASVVTAAALAGLTTTGSALASSPSVAAPTTMPAIVNVASNSSAVWTDLSRASRSRTCLAPVATGHHLDPDSAPTRITDPQPGSLGMGADEWEPRVSGMDTDVPKNSIANPNLIGIVAGTCVNVRSTSELTPYNIVNRVPAGTQLRIRCATTTGWYKTVLGYISSTFVDLASAPPRCVMHQSSKDPVTPS